MGSVFSWVGIALVPGALLLGQVEEAVELEPYLVTASPFIRSQEELVVPVIELAGEELARVMQSSLGATLEGQPGVHSTYFGPGAGRPIIRGFDGGRVRILNQGTDTFDVSEVSPDHGVAVEPLFARDIEVVRGPASLLYGNAAIGGVVNVIGKELPQERATRPMAGSVLGSYASVSDERSLGFALEGGSGDFAWSSGYLERSAGDLEIPGFAESRYQMEAEGENGEDEVFGVLGNSFVDTRTGYLGAAVFKEKGEWAVAFSKIESAYGVPGHAHEHEEAHRGEGGEEPEEEEEVSIDLDQSRLSFRGEVREIGFGLQSVELQGSYGNYQHRELEGAGVGTVFDRGGVELRLTAVHSPVGKLTGAFGLHLRDESFDARGEEAFVPRNDGASSGVFVVERLDQEWGAWEFGGRIESVDIGLADGSGGSRRFTTANASAGVVRRVGDGSSLAANVTYAERAPSASELFAFGPHVGTRRFEIGNGDLDKEVSANLDLSYRVSAGRVTGELAAFYSDFSDYVYMQSLDEVDVVDLYGDLDTHGLGVLKASAVAARFYGFELDLRFHLIDEPARRLHLDLLLDQTRATNDSSGTNLPRIPTRRVGVRGEYAFGAWQLGLEGRRHSRGTHLAPNELPTDSYFLWGADVRYRIHDSEKSRIDLFATGSNLGDEQARPHTSYLKDLTPMPGRNVRLGVRSSW